MCVCYSQSHLSNVRSSHKRYDLLNRATKVRNFEQFSLKMLRCKARALPPLYSSRHFITAENAHARYIRLRGGWSRHFITAENAHARYIRLRGGKRPFVSRGSPVP